MRSRLAVALSLLLFTFSYPASAGKKVEFNATVRTDIACELGYRVVHVNKSGGTDEYCAIGPKAAAPYLQKNLNQVVNIKGHDGMHGQQPVIWIDKVAGNKVRDYDPCHVSTTEAILIGMAGQVPQLPPGCDGSEPSATPEVASGTTDQSSPSVTNSSVAVASEINLPHGNENAEMCIRQKQSLLDIAGQLGAQRSACEKVEMAKDRRSMATFRHYCNIDMTGHGVEKAPSRCGYVEIECAACRSITIESACASQDAYQLQCPSPQVAK